MKTWRNWLILSTLLVPSLALAQEAAPSVPASAPTPSHPGENVLVHLQGKYQGVPVDMKYVEDTSVAGVKNGSTNIMGMADMPIGPPLIFSISTLVKASDGGYLSRFDIGARVPRVNANSPTPRVGTTQTTPNFTYAAVSANTTVLLQPGHPIMILEGNDSLTATLEKLPDGSLQSGMPTLGNDGQLSANLKVSIKITHADGAVSNFSGIMGGAHLSLTTVASMDNFPQAHMEHSLANFKVWTVQLQNEQDGLGVYLVLGNRVPVFTSYSPNILNYNNVTKAFNVAVKKLDAPTTVFSDADETITLTLSRAGQ